MSGEGSVTVKIPRERVFRGEYWSVPGDLVEHTIQLLQCVVAQWTWPEDPREAQAATRVTAAACSALAGLMDVYAEHSSRAGAQQLVEQVQGFLERLHAHEDLEALRGAAVDQDILAALLDLQPLVKAKALTPRRRPSAAAPGENHGQ